MTRAHSILGRVLAIGLVHLSFLLAFWFGFTPVRSTGDRPYVVCPVGGTCVALHAVLSSNASLRPFKCPQVVIWFLTFLSLMEQIQSSMFQMLKEKGFRQLTSGYCLKNHVF